MMKIPVLLVLSILLNKTLSHKPTEPLPSSKILSYLGGFATPVLSPGIPDDWLQINTYVKLPCLEQSFTKIVVAPLVSYPLFHDLLVHSLRNLSTSGPANNNGTPPVSPNLDADIKILLSSLDNLRAINRGTLDRLQGVIKASYNLNGLVSDNKNCVPPANIFAAWAVTGQYPNPTPSNGESSFPQTRRKRDLNQNPSFQYNQYGGHHFSGAHNWNSIPSNTDSNPRICSPQQTSQPKIIISERPTQQTPSPVDYESGTMSDLKSNDIHLTSTDTPISDREIDNRLALQQAYDMLHGLSDQGSNTFTTPLSDYWRSIRPVISSLVHDTPYTSQLDYVVCPHGYKKRSQCRIFKTPLSIEQRRELLLTTTRPYNLPNILSSNEHHRHKRAVVPFMGKTYRWLFGTATLEDLDGFKDTLATINNRMTGLRDFVVNTKKQLTLMISTSVSDLQLAIHRVENAMQSMAVTVDDLGDTVRQLWNQSEKQREVLVVMDTLNRVMIHIQSINLYLGSLNDHLDTVEAKLQGLIDMVRTQSVNPTIINWHQIEGKARKLIDQLGGKLTLDPDLDFSQIDYTSSVKIIDEEGYLHIFTSVPVYLTNSQQQVWHIQFLPIVFKGAIVKVTYPGDYLVMDETLNRHRWITESEKSLCDEVFQGHCAASSPWMVSSRDECIIPAMQSRLANLTECRVSIAPLDDALTVQVIQYQQCSWGIQPFSKAIEMLTSCPSLGGSMTDSRFIITNFTSVNLREGCSASMQTFTLSCGTTLIPKSADLLIDPFSDLDNVTKEIDANMLFPMSPLQLNIPIVSQPPTVSDLASQKYVFLDPHSEHKLGDLITSSTLDTRQFIVKDTIRAKMIDNQIAKLAGSDQIWAIVESVLVVYSAVICSLILLKWIILKRNRRAIDVMTAGMIPMASNLPKSYARPLAEYVNKTSITEAMVKQFNQLPFLGSEHTWFNHGGNIHNTITNSDGSVVTSHGYVTVSAAHHPWVIALVTIIIHAVLMYIIMLKMTRQTNELKYSLGESPRNREGNLHVGEHAVHGSFIVEVKSFFSRHIERKEIRCLITTLPRSAAEWFCTVDTNVNSYIQSAWTSRFRKHISWGIKWGPLCIRSLFDEDLETCSSMPPVISLPSSDITSQLGHSDISWWHKIRVVAISKLYLRSPGYYRELYAATVPIIQVTIPSLKTGQRGWIVMTPAFIDSPISDYWKSSTIITNDKATTIQVPTRITALPASSSRYYR